MAVNIPNCHSCHGIIKHDYIYCPWCGLKLIN